MKPLISLTLIVSLDQHPSCLVFCDSNALLLLHLFTDTPAMRVGIRIARFPLWIAPLRVGYPLPICIQTLSKTVSHLQRQRQAVIPK